MDTEKKISNDSCFTENELQEARDTALNDFEADIIISLYKNAPADVPLSELRRIVGICDSAFDAILHKYTPMIG